MHADQQPISGTRQTRSLRVAHGNDRAIAPSFIQIVQDTGDWFEPHDIVELVRRARQSTASQLVRAERGRYEVVACAPVVSGQGKCLEVSLRELRRR